MISRKCSGSFLSLVTLVPRVMTAAASCQCVAGEQELLRAGLLWKTGGDCDWGFFLQMMESNLPAAGMVQLADAASVEDGFRPPPPPSEKSIEGSGTAALQCVVLTLVGKRPQCSTSSKSCWHCFCINYLASNGVWPSSQQCSGAGQCSWPDVPPNSVT